MLEKMHNGVQEGGRLFDRALLEEREVLGDRIGAAPVLGLFLATRGARQIVLEQSMMQRQMEQMKAHGEGNISDTTQGLNAMIEKTPLKLDEAA